VNLDGFIKEHQFSKVDPTLICESEVSYNKPLGVSVLNVINQGNTFDTLNEGNILCNN